MERRRATEADQRRLSGARDTVRGSAVSMVVVDERQGLVQIVDRKGWSELIKGRTYVLTDPDGNTVTRRRATGKDRARMLAQVPD